MRKILICGNWKMNLNISEASILVHRLSERIRVHKNVEVVLAPSALALQPMSMQIDRHKFRLAAQNAYFKDQGAYTGEISFNMLRDLVHYAIIGHSERRHKFGENLDMIRDKVSAAVRNGITPILCIGETKTEHLAHETRQVVHDQLVTAVSDLTGEEVAEMVVAYEPVWAISDGVNYAKHVVAKPDEVEKVVKQIRSIISDLYGKKVGANVRVLYGGSSSSQNARAYLSIKGVDGLLPGGASLNYQEFSTMVDIANQVARKNQPKEVKNAKK